MAVNTSLPLETRSSVRSSLNSSDIQNTVETIVSEHEGGKGRFTAINEPSAQ